MPRALVGREQAAQHADGGGLAGAVGPEEAVDRAALHLHRQIAHHRAAVELLGQAMHVDDDIRLLSGAHCDGHGDGSSGSGTVDRLADAEFLRDVGQRLDQEHELGALVRL